MASLALIRYGSACSAWPTSLPDWTTPGKSRRCEMCAIGCAHRHKLTEHIPTGTFPQLAWQPAAVARSALLIHAPPDATAALVRRAKHCQQTWPDALSQRPTSTDSILSRNVDERTASESLSNTQRPLGLHRAQPVPAPGSNPSQDRQEDHYLGRCQQIAVRHGRRLQRGAAGCLGAVRSQGAAGPTAPGAAHRANPQGCHGRRCSFYNHQKCYSSTPNSAVLQTMANSRALASSEIPASSTRSWAKTGSLPFSGGTGATASFNKRCCPSSGACPARGTPSTEWRRPPPA